MYKIGPYNPFPNIVGGNPFGDKAVAIIPENIWLQSRWVYIFPERLNIERLIQTGLKLDFKNDGYFQRVLKFTPREDAYWIYTLVTYVANPKEKRDGYYPYIYKNFTEAMDGGRYNGEDFMLQGFDDFNELMIFCKKKFGVSVTDFRRYSSLV